MSLWRRRYGQSGDCRQGSDLIDPVPATRYSPLDAAPWRRNLSEMPDETDFDRAPGGAAASRRRRHVPDRTPAAPGGLGQWIRAAGLSAILACTVLPPSAMPANGAENACVQAGTWIDPKTGDVLAVDALISSLATRSVVLLGERHTDPEHHRWQAAMLAALQAHRPALAVGFEMFPRSVQPALDAWSRGELSTEAFLRQSRWREVWGFDEGLYLPLLHFARANRLPALALNVERSLVARVGRQGWRAVPAAEREGLTDPAEATADYRQSLVRIYAQTHRESGAENATEDAAPDLKAIMAEPAFQNFVAAQLTWDRAMAEAIAAAREADPSRLVIGIMGRGHIEHGWGVPHQLADLGIADVAVLLPMTATAACDDMAPDLADAVFIVDASDASEAPPDRPRLGVMVERADDGVRVLQVVDDSVAAAAELVAGDIIVMAAGQPIKRRAELIAVIQRQAPGTWLPLDIKRDGEIMQRIAKFPTAANDNP